MRGMVINMDTIYIKLLRDFSIVYKGVDIASQMGKSPKSISVIKYLILNHDRAISVNELIEYFWNDDSGQNPESALKTLISRIRKAFSSEYAELKGCIVSDQGTYRWAPSINCEIDVFEFEGLCQRILSDEYLNGSKRGIYERILALYPGDIDASSATDEWIIGRSQHYHTLYLRVMYRYIKLFKEDQNYDMLISLCRMALNIEPFDETLNIALMSALKETRQSNAALAHYKFSTDMYYKYLGIDPPDRMLGFYKELIKSDLSEKDSLATIREKLSMDDQSTAAFLCDYSIFKDMYLLQLRNIDRMKVQMYLALFIIESSVEVDPLVMDKIMRSLQDIIMTALRKGDIVTRYSSTQYAVLLAMSSHKDGDIVLERINRLFWKAHTEPYISLHYQMTALGRE